MRDNRRGFTLIEILIVVAIIGIASTITLVSLNSGRTDRELEAAAREFASGIREAQNYALTGKQAVASTDPCRYQMNWSGGQYTLTYWYAPAGGSCAVPSSSTVVTYTLKGGVAFVGALDSVWYKPPHAANDIAASKLITLSKSGRFHSVCLYKNGRVLDQPGQLMACP